MNKNHFKNLSHTVIIPDADKDLSLSVIRCLGRLSKLKIVLVGNKSLPASYSRFCHKFYLYDHKSDQDLLSYIQKVGEMYKPAVILPVTLDGFKLVSKFRAQLSNSFYVAPMPTLQNIEDASDKWILYNKAVSAGISVLPSYLLSKDLINEAGVQDLIFPLLIKSRNRKGGFGFKVISDQRKLESICAGLSATDSDEYMVQSYIDATDYSLSVYCENGEIKAYTLWKALLYGGRKFSIPRAVQFVHHEKVIAAGKKLMKTLLWDGVADIDFIVGNIKGEISLLEINARFWQTVPACLEAGVNFPEIMYRAALKDPIPDIKQKENVIYARPSAIPDLIRNKWSHGRGKGIATGINSLMRLFQDPLPELSRVFTKS